ncbi:ABC transporter substrate-binding protein [Roseovarius faecimaris]|uniref:ABC transporter substrate-binding protein n=1 Tax=Roseovarius faecimaris TaxID=2494550 RepID=A0A6I6IT60_9RHOB|nr:ABC transporter substrate-binding protein [Roseovarius faecimaris]
MSGFVRISEAICRAARALVAGAAVALAGPVWSDAPERVVSINLCTDQLAMLLAGQGQLHSVSRIASDRNVSPMADEAARYLTNYGQAEEVYMMQPDLVLAGRFTPAATVEMLEGLGIEVVIFDITKSIDGVREQILKMGEVLHREEAAAALLAEFDARRAVLEEQGGARPSAMLYYANGYTSGTETLANEILELAGFSNAAIAAGYNWGQKMPLEVLALTDPDLVITSQPYPGGSRAEDVMAHPVVRAMKAGRANSTMADSDWVCGTPFVLRAAEKLAALRREMTGAAQ